MSDLYNVNRTDGHMIHCDAVSDLMSAGNVYSIVGPTQEFLSFAPGECRGVAIAPRLPMERKLS